MLHMLISAEQIEFQFHLSIDEREHNTEFVLPLTHLNCFETNYAFPILRLVFVAIDVYVCRCVCV